LSPLTLLYFGGFVGRIKGLGLLFFYRIFH
jgi:hypothetical protein